jgi:hypothetical protein
MCTYSIKSYLRRPTAHKKVITQSYQLSNYNIFITFFLFLAGDVEVIYSDIEVTPLRSVKAVETQTELTAATLQHLEDQLAKVQPVHTFSIDNMSDEMTHHYTGLETKEKFFLVLRSLGDASYRLNYYKKITPTLNIPNQLLLTLIKLRRHSTNYELSLNFGTSKKQVANIFITWVNFMHCQWRELNLWPSQNLVRYFCPQDFKSNFPKTRVILDGTECPMKKPQNPLSQQKTFSTYKNRNTVKVIVGATPGGLISYIGEAYGGSASDRQIVERSDLVELCTPHDEIMVDKGFNVEDIFLPARVGVNIPTFFKKKNRLAGDLVIKDRKVSSKRVHIERAIGLGKTYKILTEPLSPVESSLANEIIFVCFMLCNFRKRIVSASA